MISYFCFNFKSIMSGKLGKPAGSGKEVCYAKTDKPCTFPPTIVTEDKIKDGTYTADGQANRRSQSTKDHKIIIP